MIGQLHHHRARGRAVQLMRAIAGAPADAPPRQLAPLPRAAPPDHIALEYFSAIRFVADAAHDAFAEDGREIVRMLAAKRKRGDRADAGGGDATTLVDRAARRFADTFRPHELHALARQFGKKTDAFQREQLGRQLHAAMGVPFSAIEKPTRDRVEGFAALNVDLIKTVPERYFDRIRQDVIDAFAGGTYPETLAESFSDRYGMALDDARRIARDQVGKLNAQVNQDRQQALGLTGGTWRTMNDNRVCDDCDPMDGEHFEWDSPPAQGLPGECHPLDRCYAEPDLSPLLGGDEEAPEDAE